MDIKSLIQEKLGVARYEFQLKLKGSVLEEKLLDLGAKKIGSVVQEDKFFIKKGKSINKSEELIRVRKEGEDRLLFTYKGPAAGKRIKTRPIINQLITDKDISGLRKDYEEIIGVNKRRTVFILDKILISLDHVEHLGDFIEFDVPRKDDSHLIYSLIKKLELDPESITNLSYCELALINLDPVKKTLLKIHERFGKLSFGISSAVLTTLGVVVGINAAIESNLAIIGGIVAIAISDSLSDAVAIYTFQKSERVLSKRSAFKKATDVFFSKIIFTLSFMVPFVIFPVTTAIFASIIWGLLLLSFVSIQIAFIQETNMLRAVIKNIIIAFVVISLSYLAGKAIALIF